MKNYIVSDIKASLNTGHIEAKELLQKIKDHDGSPAYHCVFDLEPRTSFKDYEGVVKPALGLIIIDFDSPSNNPQLALDQVKEFITDSGVKDYSVYYSGNKGFHLYIPKSYFKLSGNNSLEDVQRIKHYIHKLYKKYSCIDTSIYSANHKIRMPRSKHEKTGLYKIQLTEKELSLSIEQIRELAQTNREFNPVTSRAFSEKFYKMLEAEETKETSEDSANNSQYKAWDNKPCISRLFSKRADEGSRHKIATILMSDMFHRGEHYSEAEKKILNWAQKNGIANREQDLLRYLNDLYSGKASYSFGCKDPFKAENCSSFCPIWSRLKPETRPQPLDAPNYSTDNFDVTKIPERRRLNLKSLDQLFKEPDPEQRWLCDKLLLKGAMSSLSGPPKTGKSTISRRLTVDVSEGKMFLGRKTEATNVIYIAVEEDLAETKQHFKDLGVKEGAKKIFVHCAENPENLILQLKLLHDEFKPGLIILDTLTKLSQVEDLNDPVSVNTALDPFHEFAKEFGTHILFVHHLVKGGKGWEAMAGSYAVRGAFSCNMLYERETHGSLDLRLLSSEQRNGDDFEKHQIVFDKETRNPSLGKSYNELIKDLNLKKIANEIIFFEEPMTKAEIKTASGLGASELSYILKSGLDQELFIKTGTGKRAKFDINRKIKPGAPF